MNTKTEQTNRDPFVGPVIKGHPKRWTYVKTTETKVISTDYYRDDEGVIHKEGGYSYPRHSENRFGKEGHCITCTTEKSTLVNGVCLICSMPLRKNKHH